MKILVTGGAGFIASHLVDRLILEGFEVVIVDNLSTGKKEHIHPKAKFYNVDIQSKRLEKIFQTEKPEVVSHHAAQIDVRRSVLDPASDAKANILGLLNLLECAVKNGTRRVLFASSGGAVYGEQKVFPANENHPTAPLSPYGVSKLSSEHYLYYYHKVCGLEYTILRYGNVYGPRQDPHGEAGVVAIFTQKLLKGELPVINGDGMQTRDYVFVEDVVEANMTLLINPVTDIFNVGTGKETSVEGIFHFLSGLTDPTLHPTHGPAKKGEQLRSCIDWQKIYQATKWEPRVSLHGGLAKTVAYFRQR